MLGQFDDVSVSSTAVKTAGEKHCQDHLKMMFGGQDGMKETDLDSSSSEEEAPWAGGSKG